MLPASGLVDLDALVPVHLHVDDHVGLAEVVDEGRVDGLCRFVSTGKEVDLLPVRPPKWASFALMPPKESLFSTLRKTVVFFA